MNLAVLFLFSLTCLVGVALGIGKSGSYAFSPTQYGNPYQQAAVPLRPPPFYGPPGYIGYGGAYGYGSFGVGRGIGLGRVIFGVLGFFFLMFILFMGFGLLSRFGGSSGGSTVIKTGTSGSSNTRPVIIVSDTGVTEY